ncbi:MAG: hypothetical protein NTX91_02570 [candidate division SR1 bacterium]|nr:hypothetical protein [candidate division SR1 bacterium]
MLSPLFTHSLITITSTKNIAKKKFKQAIDSSFAAIRKNKIYLWIKKMPWIFRIIIFLIGVVLFVIEIIFAPRFSFGEIALIIGFAIIFPIDLVKSRLCYVVNKTRITWLYAQWLQGKQRIKRKRSS